MEIIVCGPGCSKCDEVERVIKETVSESESKAEVSKEKDFNEFAKYGVFSTPAVVINGQIRCVGKIPTKSEILSWLE